MSALFKTLHLPSLRLCDSAGEKEVCRRAAKSQRKAEVASKIRFCYHLYQKITANFTEKR